MLTSETSPSFDQLAADYDSSFTSTRLGRWLRAEVWSQAETTFAGADRILEIGCGTGEDAVHLARLGHRIVATDASSVMLAVARRKAESAGLSDRIEFQCIPMEELGATLRGETFDGVLSDFGAINCVSQLPALVEDVASLLAPRARMLWVVMGRYVPWEWAWFLVRLEWRKAFRRLREDGVAWRGMRIQYPAPQALARTLGSDFCDVHATPLGILLPPSYAADWLNRRPRLFSAFAAAESIARRMAFLAPLADHYMIEARRR